jgi:hypothetical protein
MKRCKPTHKNTIGFKSCEEIKDHHKYGLCMDCFKAWLKTDHGIKYALKMIPRAKNKVKKEKRTMDKKARIESKTIKSLIADAKTPFQKLIRIRDHRKQDICCEEMLPFDLGKYDAGHYKKADIYSGLIFHPDNVHGQRKYCNHHLDGNEANYTTGLIKRIGWARYNKLIALSIKYKKYKWDRYYLIELKQYYTMELNAVESGKKDISEVDFSIGIINK